jgi:hypothetical protein
LDNLGIRELDKIRNKVMYVIAGSSREYKQFLRYLRQQGDNTNYYNLSNEQQLRGISGTVLLIGEYKRNHIYHSELYNARVDHEVLEEVVIGDAKWKVSDRSR